MQLHLSKVAVGCGSLDILAERIASRTENEVATVTTRYRPVRHAELIGGSLYWIIKHRLVARQTILGFEELPDEKRWTIRLDARLVPVVARPKRVHQGWRYLKGRPPADLSSYQDAQALPPGLLGELAAIGLV